MQLGFSSPDESRDSAVFLFTVVLNLTNPENPMYTIYNG